MQTLTRPRIAEPGFKPPRKRRRFSPLMLIGVGVTLLIVLSGGTWMLVRSGLFTHAADANPNCTLIVPVNPLSARGLATPFQLVATDPGQGPCNEANPDQSAFVEGAVLDPATGKISIYNPLVIDRGTQPAAAPVVPQLPRNAVVALWFGYNGDNLTLRSARNTNSLRDGRCVNGVRGSIFGQYSYCNAPAFFAAANKAIAAGKITPPPLGTAKDGMPCPTVRDFSVVDQDQSDNVPTEYLLTADGKTAQVTAANTAKLQNAQILTNGSDNRLLDIGIDGALGCTPWMAPNLADPAQMLPALPLNELQAAAHQGQPVALVPAGDPMVLVDGKLNLDKLNAYRAGVNMAPVNSFRQADTRTYCTQMLTIAPKRFQLDEQLTRARPSPDPATGNNLFTFLAARFNDAVGPDNLNCEKLVNQKSPITITTDENGVAIDAKINLGGNGGADDKPINCTVNGNQVAGCAGTTTINGQQCTFAFDKNANQVNINCQQGDQGGNQTAPGGTPQPTPGGDQANPQPTPGGDQANPQPTQGAN
ncbi:MAG: hypothetical protein J2P36_15020 [Ktedonobacteraceae bacterium]|nr:hypothetical protein [Ktedonobacteraceae bacterium]